MADSRYSICLYKEAVGDLQEALASAKKINCHVLITLIFNPSLGNARQSISDYFTRPDLLLSPAVWQHQIIIKLSDSIDCDTSNENLRTYNESMIKKEIAFAQYLAVNGRMLIKIRGIETANLARIVSSELNRGKLLIEIPMVVHEARYINGKFAKQQDPWHWWNSFRTYADYHANIGIALEMPMYLPDQNELLRWMGEPVNLLIIPTYIFNLNNNKFPALTRQHKAVVLNFLSKTKCQLVLKSAGESNLNEYVDYLEHLLEENSSLPIIADRSDDILKDPLQPLNDNLDSDTYEVFEQDPIKYIRYQFAIKRALLDKISEVDALTKVAVVMVLGAGRGPLVRSVINASKQAGRRIKLYVVEKNPNAIVTLKALQDEMWHDEDLTIIASDMRKFTLLDKADILVSELLGSFGDNELSPECLYGAQNHLKPDGISIPCQSTSYLNPVMTQKLVNSIRNIHGCSRQVEPINYEIVSEKTYVTFMRNVFHITKPRPVFSFVYPNPDKMIDNTRSTELQFDVGVDCLLTGFAGYFDINLYKNIKLSIHPLEHTNGLISWFSMYFPLSEPQHLHAGDKIRAIFKRCESSHGVWYEWKTTAPYRIPIHNFGGRSSLIHK